MLKRSVATGEGRCNHQWFSTRAEPVKNRTFTFIISNSRPTVLPHAWHPLREKS